MIDKAIITSVMIHKLDESGKQYLEIWKLSQPIPGDEDRLADVKAHKPAHTSTTLVVQMFDMGDHVEIFALAKDNNPIAQAGLALHYQFPMARVQGIITAAPLSVWKEMLEDAELGAASDEEEDEEEAPAEAAQAEALVQGPQIPPGMPNPAAFAVASNGQPSV